ncbi:class I lanthipeptide [Mucilaginibacter terrenus]|uniref:class I lanthipeptide n=1 Tax=Mucilaginibacter terrenus TaxID=2482727 RepID=UPI0010584861|nr:class I lanthipeptide [Mucilaginibacter terrenus]
MRKIQLNREKLQLKKLSLFKDKISDLNTESMLNVLGGSGYISQVVHCGSTAGSGNPQGCVGATTALGSCFSACGC